MDNGLNEIRADALDAAQNAPDLRSIEDVRVRFLGRKGRLTEVLRGLGQMSEEERRALGQRANQLKNELTEAIDARKADLEAREAQRKAGEQSVDLSLPGRRPPQGHLHPVQRIADEICDIFLELGYQIAKGPDIETEYYNFDALNTPEDHPARDTHDTFFVKPGVVLRTQTSPVQMRVMEMTQPPVAVVVPGRVYRVDSDATHSPMFYQIEGLLVDEHVTFADLKGTLNHFVHRFFGPDVETRFRPHFFPFTEPSAEMDVAWEVDTPNGKQKRWLEMLGCGMVDPEVFRYAGYDSERYTGLAFGMGVDRITMVRHRVTSINYLYDNDLRFLEQF